jgi:AcrR family transcriptional regulator
MNDAAFQGTALPSPAARRERRDAAAHRCHILATARQLFAAHGVAAVSMHQIARAAGVGQGTLYRRYANKGELCLDLVRDEHERFAGELLKWVGATADTLPALARLDGVLTRMLTFIEESMPLFETIATARWRELAACADPLASHASPPDRDPSVQWLHDLLARLLDEAVARDEIAPLDVAFTADMILGALNPLCLRFLYARQGERGDVHARTLAGLRRIFITGIKGR